MLVALIISRISHAQDSISTSTQPYTNSIGIRLLHVPKGSFLMGSPKHEIGRSIDEGPTRIVDIKASFWVSETEVTQEQWGLVMDSSIQENRNFYAPGEVIKWQGNNYPMRYVSYLEVLQFCLRLTRAEKDTLPEGYWYGLPKEAEWEYFARAGTTSEFSFSENLSEHDRYKLTSIRAHNVREKNNRTFKYSNESLPLEAQKYFNVHNTHGKLLPVGQLKPNPWGIHDVHGNVSEMSFDYYSEYPNGELDDFASPSNYKRPVVRGGSYNTIQMGARSASRQGDAVLYSGNKKVGFRVILKKGQNEYHNMLSRYRELIKYSFKVKSFSKIKDDNGKPYSSATIDEYVFSKTENSTWVLVYNAKSAEKKAIARAVQAANLHSQNLNRENHFLVDTLAFHLIDNSPCPTPIVQVFSNGYRSAVNCAEYSNNGYDLKNQRGHDRFNHGYSARIGSFIYDLRKQINQ